MQRVVYRLSECQPLVRSKVTEVSLLTLETSAHKPGGTLQVQHQQQQQHQQSLFRAQKSLQ